MNLFPVKLLNYFIKPGFVTDLHQEEDSDKTKQTHSLHFEFSNLTSQ